MEGFKEKNTSRRPQKEGGGILKTKKKRVFPKFFNLQGGENETLRGDFLRGGDLPGKKKIVLKNKKNWASARGGGGNFYLPVLEKKGGGGKF